MGVVTTFLQHHLPWVIIVIAGVVGVHTWQGEHDARLAAEKTIAVDQQQVAVLQQSITQNNVAIQSLQQQMAQRDSNAAKQLLSITQLVSKVQTPSQVVAALPSVAQLPSVPTANANGDITFPSVDALPLFTQLSDGSACRIKLQACSGDLTDQKAITAKDDATMQDQTKQLGLKDDEIKTLKKKPSFWHRVGATLKEVGVGFGIGIAVAHKF